MTTIRYLIPQDPHVEWEIPLYHTIVTVRGGVVETDDQVVVDALCQHHGFELVHVEPTAAPTAKTEQERSVMEEVLGRNRPASASRRRAA